MNNISFEKSINFSNSKKKTDKSSIYVFNLDEVECIEYNINDDFEVSEETILEYDTSASVNSVDTSASDDTINYYDYGRDMITDNVNSKRCISIKNYLVNNHVDMWFEMKAGDIIRIYDSDNTRRYYYFMIKDADCTSLGKLDLVELVYNREYNTLNVGCVNMINMDKYKDINIVNSISKKDMKKINRMKIKGYVKYSNEKIRRLDVSDVISYYHFYDQVNDMNIFICVNHVSSRKDLKLFFKTMRNVLVKSFDDEYTMNILNADTSGRYMLKSDINQYLRCNCNNSNSLFI